MTKRQDLGALEKKGEAYKPLYTRKELLLIAAKALENEGGDPYRGYPNLERPSERSVRSIKIRPESALAPVEKAFAARGIPTNGHIGALLDAGLTQDDLHETVCYCHGDRLTANSFGNRFYARAEEADA